MGLVYLVLSLTITRSPRRRNQPNPYQSIKSSHSCTLFPTLKSKWNTNINRRLPAELRNRIYGFALSDCDDIYVTSTTKGYRRIAKRCTQPDCVPQFSRHHYRRYSRFNSDISEDE